MLVLGAALLATGQRIIVLMTDIIPQVFWLIYGIVKHVAWVVAPLGKSYLVRSTTRIEHEVAFAYAAAPAPLIPSHSQREREEGSTQASGLAAEAGLAVDVRDV
jgi:hypothetical protein